MRLVEHVAQTGDEECMQKLGQKFRRKETTW